MSYARCASTPECLSLIDHIIWFQAFDWKCKEEAWLKFKLSLLGCLPLIINHMPYDNDIKNTKIFIKLNNIMFKMSTFIDTLWQPGYVAIPDCLTMWECVWGLCCVSPVFPELSLCPVCGGAQAVTAQDTRSVTVWTSERKQLPPPMQSDDRLGHCDMVQRTWLLEVLFYVWL